MTDDLKNLEIQIQKFNNWNNPLELNESIINNKDLAFHEKELFASIWDIALDYNNWNDSDLILGCKITQARLRKESKLSDDSIAKIVKAASYHWK